MSQISLILISLTGLAIGCSTARRVAPPDPSPDRHEPAMSPSGAAGASTPSAAPVPAVVASTAPSAAAAARTQQVPTLYARTASRTPVAPGRWELILATARRKDGRDEPIWCVGVEISYASECRATVYYPPERSSPRLRTGRAVQVWVVRNGLFWGEDKVQFAGLREYVDVSPADRPFAAAAGVPVPPPAAFRDTPFPRPKFRPSLLTTGKEVGGERRVPMADEMVIRLVDAARAAFDPPSSPEDPLCYIAVKGRDTYLVARGVWDFSGEAVYFEARPDGVLKQTGGVGWSGSLPWH